MANQDLRRAIRSLFLEVHRELPGADRARDLSDPGPGVELDLEREVVSIQALCVGLGGIPYSDSHPNGWPPDPVALYTLAQGVWQVEKTTCLAGNVYWTSTDGQITLSWLWGTDNPDAKSNACKYLFDPAAFAAGAISGRIYNRGREIVQLPTGYACCGAAYVPGYVLVMAISATSLAAGYYAASLDAEGRVEIAPGATFQIVNDAYSAASVTQQMLFAPNGTKSGGVYFTDSFGTTYADILEFVWTFNGAPSASAIETFGVEPKFEIQHSTTTTNETADCVAVNEGPGLLVDVEDLPCIFETGEFCGQPTTVAARGQKATYSGYENNKTVKFTEHKHVVDIAATTVYLAIDWNDDSEMIIMDLRVDGTSLFTDRVENGFRTESSHTGNTEVSYSLIYNPEPKQCEGVDYPNDHGYLPSAREDGQVDKSQFKESYRESAKTGTLSVTIGLYANGVKVATLGQINESYDLRRKKPLGTGIGWERYSGTVVVDNDSAFADPTITPCGADTDNLYRASANISPNLSLDSSAGDYDANCPVGFESDYTLWDFVGSAECRNRLKADLTFCDVRAGVFVLHEHRGNLPDLDKFQAYQVTETHDVGSGDDKEDDAFLLVSGVEKDRAASPVAGLQVCLMDADPLSTQGFEIAANAADFVDLGQGLSGAATWQGSSLVAAQRTLDDPVDGELRVVSLYDPDGDPLILFGATGTNQFIGRISPL